MSIGTTLAAACQNLQVDVYQVISLYRHVVIHRAKLAYLISQLNPFQQSLSRYFCASQSLTPKENTAYQKLINYIKNFQHMIQSFTKREYIETLCKLSIDQVCQQITDFRINFNTNIKMLGISKIDPCPEDEVQMKIDNKSDCEEIVTIITNLFIDNQVVFDKSTSININVFRPKLEKVLVYIKQHLSQNSGPKEEAETQESDSEKLLSQDEIEAELSQFSKWGISYSDFEIQKKIGTGGFADVFLGYIKKSKRAIAIKKLHFKSMTKQKLEMFKREIGIFSSMQHFAVLPFVGAVLTYPYCIITEYMPCGSLFDRLHCEMPIDPTKLTIIALGISLGMEYLHSKHLIHRDLKSLNILLDADDFPKICDFGMSRYYNLDECSVMTGGVGTSQWMAPEVLANEPYDDKVDVYSYGILLWELLTRETPYHGLKGPQVSMAVLRQDARPIIPSNCPYRLSHLISLCWNKNPSLRPDFITISRAFENGEVYFPGTKHEGVLAYVNQFQNLYVPLEPFDPEKVSASGIDTICDEIRTDLLQAFRKLLLISPLKQWYPLITQSKLIQQIIQVLKSLNYDLGLRSSANSGSSFREPIGSDVDQRRTSQTYILNNVKCVQLFFESFQNLLQDPMILSIFIDSHGCKQLINLFLKYGTTSMTGLIECLILIIQKDDIKLSREHFSKLSPFLVTSDLQTRIKTTNLIHLVIQRMAYDEDTSITVVIHNIVKNIMKEAIPELLNISLTVFEALFKLPGPKAFIIEMEAVQSIYNLSTHPDIDIVKKVFKIMRKILDTSNNLNFSKKTYTQFLQDFGQLCKCEEIQYDVLFLLKTLAKNPEMMKVIQNVTSITQGFAYAFESSLSICNFALQICFRFLKTIPGSLDLLPLCPNLIMLLNSGQEDTDTLAASCLTVIEQSIQSRIKSDDSINPKADLINKTILVEETVNYLQRVLTSSDDNPTHQIISGLRFAGSIALTIDGALFLRNQQIIPLITNYFKPGNTPEITKLATLCIVCLSITYPALDDLVPILHTLFDNNFSGYSIPNLTAISNITLNPNAALIASDYIINIINSIQKFIRILNEEESDLIFNEFEYDIENGIDGVLDRLLVITSHILTEEPIMNRIIDKNGENSKTILSEIFTFIDKSIQINKDKYTEISLQILDSITKSGIGLQICKEKRINDFLIKIVSDNISDNIYYLRIISRLQMFE